MPHAVFDEYADEYDHWFDEHRDEYRSELARIRSVLPPPDGYAVELGVGSGRFAAPLGVPIGIEPSCSLARIAHGRGIEVVLGRAEAIPLKEASCSSVLMVTVLCYLDDPHQTFREVHRILIPKGVLVIGFIEREGEIEQEYRIRTGKSRFLSHARFYTVEEVTTLLSGSGFMVQTTDARKGFCVISAMKRSKTDCARSNVV
jgi:SAM-dependent methyltransferase